MRDFITIVEDAAQTVPLLVVVHPGSACGSANMSLGRQAANGDRDYLASDIQRWHGHVMIVDGALSDELPSYPQLNGAIIRALKAAKDEGYHAGRVYASDDDGGNWPAKVAKAVLKAKLPADTPIGITGVWYFPSDTAGCVNAVYDVLKQAGYTKLDVRDSAIVDAEERDDIDDAAFDDDDDEEENR